MAPPSPTKAGSPSAPAPDVQALAQAYAPALRRYFQKKAPSGEAEDLVQEVFLRMQVRGEGAAIDNVEGYLFTVAAHVLAQRYAGGWDWRRRTLIEDASEPREEISPERALISKQSVEMVLAAIDGLPPKMGQAFALHRFEEMTYEAIARRMGNSPRTVEKLISLALKRLVQYVETRS